MCQLILTISARKDLLERREHFFPAVSVRGTKESIRSCWQREENRNTRHTYAKKEEKKLLNQMEKYRHNHLLFLHDFSVPFDNNMSKRDLRKVKNREKMA